MPNNEHKIFKIGELLNSEDKYIIPLYQRNYSWTKVETIQLLTDIRDKCFEKGSNNGSYYIGTFVVDKNKKNGMFEIIDGQQRYTTLVLIHAVVKNLLEEPIVNCKSNLSFEEVRKEQSELLEELFDNYKTARSNSKSENISLNLMIKAVTDIEIFFEKIQNVEDMKKYADYIYKNVKIIRIHVPEDTDVIHYFEIMNNRGEQLECHEILKAKFIEKIRKTLVADGASETMSDEYNNYAVPYACSIVWPQHIRYNSLLAKEFNSLWKACSQMDRHVQQGLELAKAKKIFGEHFEIVPKNYLGNMGVYFADTPNPNERQSSSLEDILKEVEKKGQQPDNDRDEKNLPTVEKFKSIIDFPNFLLQVLKIFQKDTGDVPLDDKKLLNTFGYPGNLPDPVRFGDYLIFYRTLFDKYIIKREKGKDNSRWSLKQAVFDGGKKRIEFKNTNFVKDSNESMQKDICMLLSMLHVSFPGNSNKKWLQKVLSFFPSPDNEKNSIEYSRFRSKLLEISKADYLGYSEKGKGLNKGTSTENFLFNYLDYILWRKYMDEVRGKEIEKSDSLKYRISLQRELFYEFQFSQNNSVEHLHPQSKSDQLEIAHFKDKQEILDNFGNLCLISRKSNSKYSNYNYEAKKSQFEAKKIAESLKQVVMFGYGKWNTEQIIQHNGEMIETIKKFESAK